MSVSYEGKKVLIAGMGLSGRSAAALLSRKKARLTLYDRRDENETGEITTGAEKILGAEPEEVEVDRYDTVILSPGIPPHNPLVKNALEKGVEVKSELQLGLEFCPEVKVAAVTGTNGKTTTCLLLQYLTGGRLAGNIGKPLSSEAEKLKKGDFLILEVSSYQIPFSLSLVPDVSALLNLFPEHMDWHLSWESYIRSKMEMFLRQTRRQSAVFNSRTEGLDEFTPRIKARKIFFNSEGLPPAGAGIKNGRIYFISEGKKEVLAEADKFPLTGGHNLENLLAALCVSRLAGFKKIPPLEKFKPPAHRMEIIGEFDRVKYINDSKATNLHSVRCALESLAGPLILLMGGRSKGTQIPCPGELGEGKIKKVIAFGESAGEVARMFKEKVPVYETGRLEDAVKIAVKLARPGFTVIMSPGGSSFDQFDNYARRGEKFKKWVMQETEKHSRTA